MREERFVTVLVSCFPTKELYTVTAPKLQLNLFV